MLRIRYNNKAKIKIKRDKYRFNKHSKSKNLTEYLRSELETCTTHGLPYLVKKDIHWSERLFWAAIFGLYTALIVILISLQYTRYMEAPIVMSVEMDYFNWNVSYPALVLCPSNKVDENILSTLVNQSLERTGQNLEQYLRSIARVTLETIHDLEIPDLKLMKLIQPEDYAGLCALLFRKINPNSLSSSIKWPLSVENALTEMGMCHIINSNIAAFNNPNKWRDSNMAYTKNNIELSFHDRDFFVEFMNYTDNYQIYTCNPDDLTLYGTGAINLDTGTSLHFGVQVSSTRTSKDLHELSVNLRRCRFHHERSYERYPFYTYNICLLECRIKMIKKLCGCLPHFYKPLAQDKICNLDELRCLLYYKRELMTLSASTETLDKFDMNIKGLPRNPRDCGCLANCDGDVYQKDQEEFLADNSKSRLIISITKFPKVRVMREIIFSFYDIILRSAGVINLCIGSSFISIMELILIIVRYPIYQVVQFCKDIYFDINKMRLRKPDKKVDR